MSKSTVTISFSALTHFIKNCFIVGFILLNLDFRICINYFILKSWLLSELVRAELRMVLRAESTNYNAFFVYSSI